MKIDHAIVIGTGGTGTHLVEPLARLLAYHEDGPRTLTLVDGDKYEEGNMNRQLFDEKFLGKNKAEATAERLEFCKPEEGKEHSIDIRVAPQYVDGERFSKLLSEIVEDKNEMVLVITSVDNHATRSAIIRVLEHELKNFLFLSPGNDYSHGQVLLWLRRGRPEDEVGFDITQHPFEKYETLQFPEDHIPGIGCAAEAVSTPQLITANMSAALGCMLYVSNYLDGNKLYEEIHFDCNRMKMVAQPDRTVGNVPIEITPEMWKKLEEIEAKKKEEEERKEKEAAEKGSIFNTGF